MSFDTSLVSSLISPKIRASAGQLHTHSGSSPRSLMQFIDAERYPTVFTTDELVGQADLPFERRRYRKGEIIFGLLATLHAGPAEIALHGNAQGVGHHRGLIGARLRAGSAADAHGRICTSARPMCTWAIWKRWARARTTW